MTLYGYQWFHGGTQWCYQSSGRCGCDNNTTMMSGAHEVYMGQDNDSGEVFDLGVGKMGLRNGCSWLVSWVTSVVGA